MQEPMPEIEPTSEPTSQEPVLQRETILLSGDRGRLGLLIALCSMAGVAVGFGVSNIAIGLTGQTCPARAYHQVSHAPSQTPAWLGVCVGTSSDGGARIAHVQPDTPADVAGLEAGDVVVGFTAGGPARRARAVTSARRLVQLVQASTPGQYAAVVFRRGGDLGTARVHLASMPRAVYEAGPYCNALRK